MSRSNSRETSTDFIGQANLVVRYKWTITQRWFIWFTCPSSPLTRDKWTPELLSGSSSLTACTMHILSGCILADDRAVCRQHVMFDSTDYELFQTVPPNCLRFDCWGKPENRRHASVRVWAFSAFENNTCPLHPSQTQSIIFLLRHSFLFFL